MSVKILIQVEPKKLLRHWAVGQLRQRDNLATHVGSNQAEYSA